TAHGAPRPTTSSTTPSQSSSTPLQVSAEGPLPPAQAKRRPLHAYAPREQAPTPHRAPNAQQGSPTRCPAGSTTSSTAPLQSLSTPSQVSGAGPTKPRQPPSQSEAPSLQRLLAANERPASKPTGT